MGSEDTRVLLFGLGAIGGFYAFIFSRNPGISLSVAARSNYQAVKDNGLQINSDNHGSHNVPISNLLNSPSESPYPFDYIVCCNKAVSPAKTPPLFKSCTHASTVFVLIQNGVGNEDAFRQFYPSHTIVSCVTWTGATQTSPGVIAHSTNEGLQVGLFRNETIDEGVERERLETFAGFLKTGGTKFSIEENIQVKRWEKVVWNAAWNPFTTLTGVSVQRWLKTSSEAMALTRSLMNDMIAVGQRLGVPLKENLTDELIQRVLGMPDIYSSMYVDSRAGRELELEVIIGFPARKARELGMQVPALGAVYALTNAVNQRLIEESSQQ